MITVVNKKAQLFHLWLLIDISVYVLEITTSLSICFLKTLTVEYDKTEAKKIIQNRSLLNFRTLKKWKSDYAFLLLTQTLCVWSYKHITVFWGILVWISEITKEITIWETIVTTMNKSWSSIARPWYSTSNKINNWPSNKCK